MREEWRPVVGYEGLYEVSNMGKVKSLERMKWNGNGCYKIPERILKPKKDKGGYLQVNLSKDGKDKWCTVHRLVATAFLPNLDNLPQVNHIDENKENNCVQNLEWCSRSYNINYGTRNEKISKPILGIDRVTGLIVEFPSIREAERKLGIAPSNICACLKGRYKSCGGFYWMYADADTEE